MTIEQCRIIIEDVSPSVDCGRFAVKTVAGDRIPVSADIFKDGHDRLRAFVLWRPVSRTSPASHGDAGALPSLSDPGWWGSELAEEGNDRWSGHVSCDAAGDWIFTVCAWTDVFATWRDELRKKADAGDDVRSELLEGAKIIEATLDGPGIPATHLAEMQAFLAKVKKDEVTRRIAAALNDRLAELMTRHDLRPDATVYHTLMPLWADRPRARFGSWYEMFVRSQGNSKKRSATFREAENRLPYIADLGFDVLYLPPVHPIGHTARKGRNNSESADPGDPGSCWAIGSKDGGHTDVHPELGTIEDFDHFVEAAKNHGIEIALDFAVQCSPDHPWVKEHPQWFRHRPDGTIKYAENPPKKYKDIFPIDFDTEDRDGLYNELLRVVLFWVEHGVTIFRVDNPHTKPASFWEWLIFSVHRKHPGVLFLAEAFTRPKRMARLAKVGFTQSYTYFTWRNTREELESYGRELFCTDVRNYLRPNFFVNTPDILHAFLQEGGRPAFVIRLVLAATMSPTYGIYSGFELCENTAVRDGSEEYLDSEKYEIRVRDWNGSGNIKETVARINAIRKENPALQRGDNFRVLESTSPQIIAYARTDAATANRIVVVVNLDPKSAQEGSVGIPADLLGGGDPGSYVVTDLLHGERYHWRDYWNYVRLDPREKSAHILEIG